MNKWDYEAEFTEYLPGFLSYEPNTFTASIGFDSDESEEALRYFNEVNAWCLQTFGLESPESWKHKVAELVDLERDGGMVDGKFVGVITQNKVYYSMYVEFYNKNDITVFKLRWSE